MENKSGWSAIALISVIRGPILVFRKQTFPAPHVNRNAQICADAEASLVKRAMSGSLIIPAFDEFMDQLVSIFETCRGESSRSVASYRVDDWVIVAPHQSKSLASR